MMSVEEFIGMLKKLNGVEGVELLSSATTAGGNNAYEIQLSFVERSPEEPPPPLGVDVEDGVGTEDIFGG